MTENDTRRAARLLPASVELAEAQLAAGPALLAGLGSAPVPALRWYRIEPPALLLGMSQRPHEVDLAACAAAGVRVHRRQSGGGVVLAGGPLLMFDLALPHTDPLATPDLTASYRWLGEVWAAALAGLGVETRVVPVAEARADTAALDPLLKRVCFAGRSPYEVLAGERKIVGLAQVRRRSGALFQGGIYLHWEPRRTASLIAAPEPERAALAGQLARRVAGLDELEPSKPPTFELVARAFELALVAIAGLAPQADKWSEAELAARAEATAQYAPID